MTAEEIVRHAQNGLWFVQGPNYVSGFDSSDYSPLIASVPVLYYCNHAYKLMAKTGMFKCYRNWTLTIGTNEYLTPVDVGDIHNMFLTDADTGIEYKLTQTTFVHDEFISPQRMTGTNQIQVRPKMYAIDGNMIQFDKYPDKAYTVRMLCDVLPDILASRTDTPSQLSELYHTVIGDGGTYFCAQKGLRAEGTQIDMLSFSECRSAWNNGYKEVLDLRKRRGSKRGKLTVYDPYRR